MAYLHKDQFFKAVETWQTYRNEKLPEVEMEIKRLKTLALIAGSRRQAKKALAGEKTLAAGTPNGNTIAVCYYQDLSPDKSMLAFQKGLAAMVITDMSKITSLNVIERLRLQALLEEMKLGKTGIVDDRTAPRAGRLIGADKLVVGNLSLGIDAATSLVSASTENILGSGVCTEKREDFFKLPCCIIRGAAQTLGIDLEKQPEKICVVHTENYDAFIYFGKGLHEMDLGNWQTARNFFKEALKLDPRFDLAMYWLGACPSSASPSIEAMETMSGSELASHMETVITNTEQQAQEAKASISAGGGGGGH
jgi:tetratricopeptide (TPR) repeat protein